MQASAHLTTRRAHFNPIRNLTPDSLSRMIDAYHAGELRHAALAWEAMERRDDVLQGVTSKRKKAVSRLPWEIVTTDDSPEAEAQKDALNHLYRNLETGHAIDASLRGGLSLLIQQMMDATGKGYAVHELVWQPDATRHFNLRLNFVPLWFFENRTGRLRFLRHEHATEGEDLDPGGWMVTTGDGLMESCSIAWLFKHLPLRDWLIYCERNGMPGVKGTTDAPPGSEEWEAARQAVQDFGAEFHALMSRGTEIEAIDITSRGDLPYPALVERMDRAMAALWRGTDLATLSRSQATGASLQQEEMNLLEADDAARISETLHRTLLQHLFPNQPIRARFHLSARNRKDRLQTLQLYRQLWEMGVPIALADLRHALDLSTPSRTEELVTPR